MTARSWEQVVEKTAACFFEKFEILGCYIKECVLS